MNLPLNPFTQLGLNDDLLRGISEIGFQNPTPVQELVIPNALQTESDLLVLAQTGTGKTAAFGLPLLQLIDPSVRGVQALVLCPTRELCVQVANDLVNYSKYAHQAKVTAIYGGASIDRQILDIKRGVQIVVATPGRLIDLLERRAIALDQLSRLVLDEADEMLNMGFKDDLDTILAAAISRQSVWLFSATMPNEVRTIANNYMRNPLELSVGRKNQTNENIEHIYYVCRPDDRYSVLKRIVDSNPGIFGLIFCRTKTETKEIAEQMTRDGYNSDALHGDLSQNDRDRVMLRFRENNLQLLIATDVAARGIDVSDITHVINYGLPDDIEVYTHRSGRTGRAGKKGVSITIVTPKFEERIKHIERASRAQFARMNIPNGTDVCEKQLLHIIKNIHETEVQDSEIEPYLPQIFEELKDVSKEDLIKRFASMEFNRFLSYYKDAQDLNIYPKVRKQRVDTIAGAASIGSDTRRGFIRLFINIGKADELDKRDFVEMMSGQFSIPKRAIGDIELRRTHTYFEIDLQFAEKVRREANQLEFDGRSIRINEVSEMNSSPVSKPYKGADKVADKRFDKKYERKSDSPTYGSSKRYGSDKDRPYKKAKV